MKNSLFYILFLLTFALKAQQSLNVNLESGFNESPKFSFLNNAEDLFQVNIITSKNKAFSCKLNFRMEDELVSNEAYNLLTEVTFFDFHLNHQLGPFNLSMTIENLLGFNDAGFAIEPMIDQGVINEVYFSHEANFLISTSISYTF